MYVDVLYRYGIFKCWNRGMEIGNTSNFAFVCIMLLLNISERQFILFVNIKKMFVKFCLPKTNESSSVF